MSDNFNGFKSVYEDDVRNEIREKLSRKPNIPISEIQDFLLNDLPDVIFKALEKYDYWKNKQ